MMTSASTMLLTARLTSNVLPLLLTAAGVATADAESKTVQAPSTVQLNFLFSVRTVAVTRTSKNARLL